MNRTRMNPQKDRGIFKSTANHIRTINVRPMLMRGGYRL